MFYRPEFINHNLHLCCCSLWHHLGTFCILILCSFKFTKPPFEIAYKLKPMNAFHFARPSVSNPHWKSFSSTTSTIVFRVASIRILLLNQCQLQLNKKAVEFYMCCWCALRADYWVQQTWLFAYKNSEEAPCHIATVFAASATAYII